MIEKNPKKFITFWNDERNSAGAKPAGVPGIDAGPLTMGYRTNNSAPDSILRAG